MSFSQSLEFGNSTFMKLESEVNRAIYEDNTKESKCLDVILELPESKPALKSLVLSSKSEKSCHNNKNSTAYPKFRRSKSDSTLPKEVNINHKSVTENYSQFFESDFSFQHDITKDKQYSIGYKNTSVVRVSQIEAELEDIQKSDLLRDAYNSDKENLHENAISSEDLLDVLEIETYASNSKDSMPLDKNDYENIIEPADIIHEISTFICPAEDNDVVRSQHLYKELEESRKLLKEYQNGRKKLSEHYISLSYISPDQLKCTQDNSLVLNLGRDVNKLNKNRTFSNLRDEALKVDSEIIATKAVATNFKALKSMKAWNLPSTILEEYERKGVKEMFDWQTQCLSNTKVLFEYCNLVYSAPTSAGKTLVSEILLLKTVLERSKKVLLILPFISVVREKMFYLQDLLTAAGYRVEGFFGGYTPPGGFDNINVAICTIEKANSIINKLLEQGKLNEIGTVVVDEIHLISDPGRGYILELLLAKILYMSRKYGLQIQIITMSATLANVELLQKWLHAELYITDFRPVALQEMIKIGNKIYDNTLTVLRSINEPPLDIKDPFPTLQNDTDHVAQLCIETLVGGHSVIVFCPSKDWCENLATQLAAAIHSLGKESSQWGIRLRDQINRRAIDDVKQQLKDIPTGLDAVLDKCITYGCSFHHAGLTTEERDIVEASFKSGALKVIVATSTLSSGVNLPARRVLIRSPLFGGKQMSSLTYRQMIGRAGRTGKDVLGESILICTESNARVGKELMSADLKPLSSCLDLDSSTHLKRALLEVISSGVATSKEDIDNFVNCTLLNTQKNFASCEKQAIQDNTSASNRDYICGALDFLIEYEFIRLQTNEETQEQYYVATRLGTACLASSMPPTDGLILFAELQKSRRCFVLESELHAVYLVTPYSVCYQLQDLDWLLFLDLWEKLTPAMKKVGELVGVKESFLVRAMRGHTKLDYKLMQIHKRFYTALALQELVNEVPINIVAFKYKCTRGMLQSLQQMASTFAGIVTSFCNSLQWDTLSLIVSQFKERLYFGIHRDLIDLMRLADLNHKRARVLFNAGIKSLVDLASADVLCVEKVLYDACGFELIKMHENENEFDAAKRNEARNFFITGKAGLTAGEAAKLLVLEARKFVQYEIGVGNIKWSQPVCGKNGDNSDGNEIHMSCEENKFISDTIEYNLDHSGNKENMCHESYSENKNLNVDSKNLDVKPSITKANQMKKKEILENKPINKHSYPANILNEENIDVTKQNNFEEKKLDDPSKKRKSSENLNDILDVTPPKTKKTPPKTNIQKNSSNTPTSRITKTEHRNSMSTEEKPSTSKKAQRLLRAKQLSEIKKEEWAKRKALQQNQLINTSKTHSSDLCDNQQSLNSLGKNVKAPNKSTAKTTLGVRNSTNISKTMSTEENSETPKLLRRSPRNHVVNSMIIKKNAKVTDAKNNVNNDAFENDESLSINTGIKEVLKEADFPQCKNNSLEDEIPSSQQFVEEMPAGSLSTPQSSRFFKSSRFTLKIPSPKTKLIIKSTKLQKPHYVVGDASEPSSTSIEFSDLSMENSLIKNPIQLNASHILSCSKFETDSSSFESLDIIDICGDQQLFKGTFKELMAHKRLGFCLGLQKQCGKRKPIIGSNLLLNQATATERENEQYKLYEFQIDDASYLAGIGFCISENVVYYMNMQQEGSCKELTTEIKCKYLRMLLKSTEHTLCVYEAKEQIKIVRQILKDFGEILIGLEDPKVANWLLQPDKNHNLYNLAQQFAPECSSLINLCGSGRGYSSYGLDSDSAIFAKVRSSIEACVAIHILKGQTENLERIGTGQLQKFFIELEMPLQMSLCNMEVIGFPASSEALHILFQQMVNSMKKLETKIYEMHGSRFNLGSSSAVAKVLGLHRKSNGRVSTSKQILEKIDSPISQMIITYRKLSVTLTKNIQPLLKSVKGDRIHGQSITYTSTGRISMTEPNLQNVANDFEVVIDSEKAIISCRSAFFPTDTKRCLISSDFCQLEMRILAHLSQDAALLRVMKSEKDLFVAIAARWNKISENSVTEQLRNGTKQICYGIVYGMGMRTLAECLKCTEQEATLVSEQFHAAYPGIRSYIEKVKKFAKNNGYIETITGRRRYLENICSEDGLIKSQAERQAVNSTIQGSAADISKSAILRMEKNIVKYREKLGLEPDSVRLVLHLHDELIFEVPEEKAKKIAKVLSLTMENCVKLNVPLKVKLKIGKSWGELKEVNF